MKLVKTYGRGAKAAAALIETLEQRGAVNTAKVEPVVRRILADVHKGGDAALLRYAAKFDGLDKGSSLLVSREEMQAAWEATAPGLLAARMVGWGKILGLAGAQCATDGGFRCSDGVRTA